MRIIEVLNIENSIIAKTVFSSPSPLPAPSSPSPSVEIFFSPTNQPNTTQKHKLHPCLFFFNNFQKHTKKKIFFHGNNISTTITQQNTLFTSSNTSFFQQINFTFNAKILFFILKFFHITSTKTTLKSFNHTIISHTFFTVPFHFTNNYFFKFTNRAFNFFIQHIFFHIQHFTHLQQPTFFFSNNNFHTTIFHQTHSTTTQTTAPAAGLLIMLLISFPTILLLYAPTTTTRKHKETKGNRKHQTQKDPRQGPRGPTSNAAAKLAHHRRGGCGAGQGGQPGPVTGHQTAAAHPRGAHPKRRAEGTHAGAPLPRRGVGVTPRSRPHVPTQKKTLTKTKRKHTTKTRPCPPGTRPRPAKHPGPVRSNRGHFTPNSPP